MKHRANLNRSIILESIEQEQLARQLVRIDQTITLDQVLNRTVNGDVFQVVDYLPENSVDLVFADPPYNLDKKFNSNSFELISLKAYEEWLESWINKLDRLLKPSASIYICGDWRSSTAINRVCERYWTIQNRITWEREKGRGAKSNWKNSSEDIWFCTKSSKYTFNIDQVKIRRKVLAPYKTSSGSPKDWTNSNAGKFRDTYPSNLWTDITVPYWSMPENTEHPTQKPEKLLAKIILASSNVGDVIFDPFLGSGTTSVVAKKLERNYIGIELDEYYCCLAEKRLSQVDSNRTIQGYIDNIFWERNTLAEQKKWKSPHETKS